MSPFVKITPTARNAPPRVLLNAHHIHRLQEDSKGVVVVLKSANAVEQLPIAESAHVIAHAMKADGKPGQITVHECLEKTPVHRTTFELATIRAIEPSSPAQSYVMAWTAVDALKLLKTSKQSPA